MLSYFLKFFSIILFVGIAENAQSKECFKCEGINCLRSSKTNNKATCTDPVDNCVTVFERFTVIARGCYSSLPEEHRNKCDDMSGSECHKCYKNLCNDKGAISCLQCNSNDNADCATGVAKMNSTRCSVSTSINSYCFTRKSSDIIERGCITDTNEQLKCLNDSSCEMCITDGEDTCNREFAKEISSGSKSLTSYGTHLLVVWSILALLKI